MFHNIILLIWSYNVELFHCCLLKIAWFFSPCRDNYKIRPVTGTTRNETCPPHPDSAGQPLHITGHLFTILGKEYNPSLSLGGLPRRLGGKESLAVQEMEMRVQPQGREAALEEERAPAPASLPGKPHGQAGYVRGVAQSRTPEKAPQQPRGVNSSERSTLQAGGRGTAV